MFNFQKMMKQAQEVQFRLQEMQGKLLDIEVEGQAGGGLVSVHMNCAGKLLKINIDDSLMNSDKETLEDLLTAAINNANEAKEKRVQDETNSMMKGMDLPEGFEGMGGQGGGII